MTCILTDDEDDEEDLNENKPPKTIFKKPALPTISHSFEPSIIEIDSITSTFNSININKHKSADVPVNNISTNPVFSSLINTQRTPNKSQSPKVEIDFNSVKLFREDKNGNVKLD
jgi:hypothetical protein